MLHVLRLILVAAAALAFVMAVLPHPPRLPGDPSDKTLHIMAFLVLGGLAADAFPDRRPLTLVLALAAFGALIELVQAIPALNRDSDWIDLLADTLAALAGVYLVRRLACRAPRPEARQDPSEA